MAKLNIIKRKVESVLLLSKTDTLIKTIKMIHKNNSFIDVLSSSIV